MLKYLLNLYSNKTTHIYNYNFTYIHFIKYIVNIYKLQI